MQEARAFHHLKHVARAGNSIAQEELALHFLHGLNGCEKDANQFEYWIGLAVALGSPRATSILAEYLHKSGREIEPAIIERLQAICNQNKAVKKLLNAIVKHQK